MTHAQPKKYIFSNMILNLEHRYPQVTVPIIPNAGGTDKNIIEYVSLWQIKPN